MTRIAAYPLRLRDLVPRAKSVWLLLAVHGVGVFGFFLWPTAFAALVPVHLLFCLGVWLANQGCWEARFITWFVACGVVGFFAEVFGVETSLLFGAYDYGPTLGPALFEVPLMMAVNWSLLTAIAADVSFDVRDARGWGPSGGALFGSATLVALDGLLESFATRYGLWSWADGEVPWQNYLGWGAVSFAFLLPSHWLRLRPSNPTSGWLFGLLVIFFAACRVMGGI